FVLVLNAKKSELAKLKHQLESYQDDDDHPTTRNNKYDTYMDSHSRSVSPIHTVTTTLDDIEQPSPNKRGRHDVDTSEDDDIHEIQMSNRSKSNVVDKNQDNPLDLGNDRMDYKKSTINKHHQRQKHVTGANSISTRPFINHAVVSSTMTIPSLPDDSLSADDLLNNI
ncbi:unnamed protein product, partial [Adineta steineri]